MPMGSTNPKNAPNPNELPPAPNISIPNHDGWVVQAGPRLAEEQAVTSTKDEIRDVEYKIKDVEYKIKELKHKQFKLEQFKLKESGSEQSKVELPEESKLDELKLDKLNLEELKVKLELRLKELEHAAIHPTFSPTAGCEPTPAPISGDIPWWKRWSFSLSGLYQFSNQRSRVGDLSWQSNTAGIDFTAAYDYWPYTTLDFIYLYSNLNGSSPSGSNDVTNQHVGAVRIIQPLNPIWCDNWKPADQSFHQVNQQLATLFRAAYGGSIGSLASPNFASEHDTNNAFVGDALLDYQFAWFPCRFEDNGKRDPTRPLPQDKTCLSYSYPSLVFELSSGLEFSTQQFDSSSFSSGISTSGRQLNYLNFASLTYSFRCRWGILVGVQWNAPLDSRPVHGSKPDYANTATFTSGLVYNLYPYTRPGIHLDGRRFSLALLYSYTAFDPLSETNTLQVQVSYSF
jgi:hypothetical protein